MALLSGRGLLKKISISFDMVEGKEENNKTLNHANCEISKLAMFFCFPKIFVSFSNYAIFIYCTSDVSLSVSLFDLVS